MTEFDRWFAVLLFAVVLCLVAVCLGVTAVRDLLRRK